MKKLTAFLCFLILFVCPHALAQKTCGEYGIGLLLLKNSFLQAQRLNKRIFAQVPQKNLPNIFHVTLYQGCFAEHQLEDLVEKLRSQNFPKIEIEFEPKIEVKEERYINWKVKKTAELQKIHEKIIELASLYQQRPLARFMDSYHDSSREEQKQINAYGMAGLFEDYNPHITLFYFEQKNPLIEKIAKRISAPKALTTEIAASIIIGKLGYVGNIEEVVFEIELNY